MGELANAASRMRAQLHDLAQNRDIGQLKRRQNVQIKYDAYPYQEYGISSIPSAAGPCVLWPAGSPGHRPNCRDGYR
ncbi:hypothetical protein WCLP8_4450002 [uncultured Gammaproteobacteria bacterium]